MLVTDIKKSFPYNKLNEVYLDYEFSFALYESELRKFKIELSKEIEPSFIEKEVYPLLKKRALNDALKIVSRADATIKTIKDKLALKKYPESAILYAEEYLLKKGFVDDLEYAKKFAKSAFDKSKGKRYVEFELIKRGIAQEIIEELINEYYKENIISDIADKKLFSLIKGKEKPDYKDLTKLRDYLYRQGFCYEEINEEITRVRQKYED